jgi:Flp pilus assembly protein TadG
MSLKTMAKGFWKNTAGNITMMFALVSVPLMLTVGAAIDFGHASYVRTVLQSAADSAALAGATSTDKSDAVLQKAVEDFLKANNADGVTEYISEIKQTYDPGEGTFRVDVVGTINTTFMAIGGIDKIDVGAHSVVNAGSKTLEIALVLDNTGSMKGAKINDLKSAAKNLVSIMESEAAAFTDLKIAVVPFAEYVNIGTSNSGATWLDKKPLGGATWDGCVGSRNNPHDERAGSSGPKYPAVAGVPCNVPLLPLNANFNTVRSKIDTMVAKGYTYIPAGLLWGWNVLDHEAPFTEGKSNSVSKAVQARKAVVLMTDGENTISPTYPLHNEFDGAPANAKLASLCDAVKDGGVEIYTVSFMVPSNTIKDILTKCASTPGQYYDAANASDLYSAFSQIARDLAAVRLTQ